MIRTDDQYASFPFVSNNAVVNIDITLDNSTQVEVICQGLEGHGQLQWILPDTRSGVETSSVGPRQLLLTIFEIVQFPDPVVEFRCESVESGASTSFYFSKSELHVI